MTILEYIETLSLSAKEIVTPSKVASALNIPYIRAVKELGWLSQEKKCAKRSAIICPRCGLMLRKGKIKCGEPISDTCYGCEREIELTHEDVIDIYDFS